MAVCSIPSDKSNRFLPPVHHGEKRNSKLFSKKVFAQFLPLRGRKQDSGDGDGKFISRKDAEVSQSEKKTPLVRNKENVYSNCRADKNSVVSSEMTGGSDGVGLQTPSSRRGKRSSSIDGDGNEGSASNRLESPPRLMPVSGKLSSERVKEVIRPIAWKPPTSGSHRSTTASSYDCLLPSSQTHDEGYNSQNMSSSSAHTSSSSSSSNASSSFLVDRSSTEAATGQRVHPRPRPKSSTVSCGKKSSGDVASLRNCGMMSEFCVNESSPDLPQLQLNGGGLAFSYRTMLQQSAEMLSEKEREIHDLRNRIEVGERTMTSVLQTRQEEWRREMETLEGKWGDKMKWQQQKSFKSERNLLIEIVDLKKEVRTLKEKLNDSERERATAERERNEAQTSAQQLRAHLEVTHRQTTYKLDEMATHWSQLNHSNEKLLKSPISSQHFLETILPHDSSSPTLTTISRQNFVTDRRKSVGCKLNPALGSSGELQTLPCPSALDEVVTQMEDLRKRNQHEQNVWLCEKSKVIDYQKRLQASYSEVSQKNQTLQLEVIRLRRKLEMSALDSFETESFC